ncbi:hypothetical protein GCM10010252_77440 [Streptomyces aureoverticillatus]|nr:hypothetical protein GCM10010252_77440 [Streptomyces aureoverticillatus]
MQALVRDLTDLGQLPRRHGNTRQQHPVLTQPAHRMVEQSPAAGDVRLDRANVLPDIDEFADDEVDRLVQIDSPIVRLLAGDG